MEGAAVAEGLWGLADNHEKLGEIGKTIKCLEAICQSQTTFLPLVEVKSRLCLSTLLLRYSHNVNHPKSHLERCLILFKSIPSSYDLKFRTYSLLSHCYHLLASFPPQRNLLLKALELTSSVPQDVSAHLWSCNFNSQLANTFIIQADFPSSLSALESGFLSASNIRFPELQMFSQHLCFTFISCNGPMIIQWKKLFNDAMRSGRPFLQTRLIAALVCSSTMRCYMFSIASSYVITRTLSIMSTA